jgi:hypothetical protein
MAPVIPNYAKGRWAAWVDLGLANDQIYWVLLKGTETDDNIENCNTLADLLATNLDEITDGSYARLVATSPTVTENDATDINTVDFADASWTLAGSGELVKRIAWVYDSDTTGGADANILVGFVDDFVVTVPTGAITYQVNAAGTQHAA